MIVDTYYQWLALGLGTIVITLGSLLLLASITTWMLERILQQALFHKEFVDFLFTKYRKRRAPLG